MIFATLPAAVRQALLTRAKGKTVALPEGSDPRVQAAATLLEQDLGVHVRLGSDALAKVGSERTVEIMAAVARSRGKILTEAGKAFDPFYDAGAALAAGEVDAVVGGVVVPTAHVIRAALATVGLASGVNLITSGFLLALKTPTPGGESVILYTDGAVIPQPTSAQLSEIAWLGSRAFESWTGIPARVAFLSFSTAGSAEHSDAVKVRQAATLFSHAHPEVAAEGELQFDAAVVPAIALQKNPHSPLKGCANVFVFPDLDAGNIGYKMAQRLAGADAWGPVMFGAGKPFSDLSRGASALDIVHSVLLTLALA